MAFNMTAAVEAANERKRNISKWTKYANATLGETSIEEIKKLPTDDIAAVEEVVESMDTEDIAATLIELVQLIQDKDTDKQAYEDGVTDMIYALVARFGIMPIRKCWRANSMTTETEEARLRREHAAMLVLLRTFANVVIPSRMSFVSEYYAGYYDAYEAVQSDVNDVLQTIDSTPATPASTEAATGERVYRWRVGMHILDGKFGAIDLTGEEPIHEVYRFDTEHAAQHWVNILHSDSMLSMRWIVLPNLEGLYRPIETQLGGAWTYTQARTEAARLNALPQAGHAAAGDGEAEADSGGRIVMRPEHTEMTAAEYNPMMFPEIEAERKARKANKDAGHTGNEGGAS